eukprot:TRINITY_DN5299_c0_g1_i1.p1 TRINITY_DN5299_c0_g1~~TRINITY_DN5299_c0_g1_i1.p1  ORF type:complete len:301 (+),score=95.94 TRINITY_DN5299_c0_g1_i1:47-949(+)
MSYPSYSSDEEEINYDPDDLDDIFGNYSSDGDEFSVSDDEEEMDPFLLAELIRQLVQSRELLRNIMGNGGNVRKKKQKCKFFMMGNCTKEEYCDFSHDFTPSTTSSLASSSTQIPISSSPSSYDAGKQNMNKKMIQCRFFTKGHCMKGDLCEFMHTSIVKVQESEISCPICEDNIEASGKKYGLLSECNHAFCLDCIKKWRQTNDVSTAKSCPICRVQSHYVVPCDVFPNEETKKVVVDSYVKNLSSVPCKYYSQYQTCPFGKNCFYSHKSGKDELSDEEEEDIDMDDIYDHYDSDDSDY